MTTLEKFKMIEEKFGLYFSDPIGSGLKAEDFILQDDFLGIESDHKVKKMNSLLRGEVKKEGDEKFLKKLLDEGEGDKVAKIQEYFLLKEVQNNYIDMYFNFFDGEW